MSAGVLLPLIFVDIDGVLLPFRSRPVGTSRAHRATVETPDSSGNPPLERLDPDHGRHLLALPGELVWASTWLGEANEVISPRLGLPALPVVDWPDTDAEPNHRLHWKTEPLVRWAAGRPFVWLDDEPTDTDRRWIAAHHPQPALLHHVDPYQGLTDTDLVSVRQWLHNHDETA